MFADVDSHKKLPGFEPVERKTLEYGIVSIQNVGRSRCEKYYDGTFAYSFFGQ